MNETRRTTEERRATEKREINTFALIGIFLGVLLIMMAIFVLMYGNDYRMHFGSKTYGADFYTDIHQAVSCINAHVDRIDVMIKVGIGSLLLFIGGIDIAYFAFKEGIYK